jgi:hypothetical protein
MVVVTRKDLKPGAQLAQSLHALSQFSLENHQEFKQWNNNYIISLSIENEQKLGNLLFNLEKKGINVSCFHEPDLSNELTSICFLENETTRKLTSSLPLSFKEFKN